MQNECLQPPAAGRQTAGQLGGGKCLTGSGRSCSCSSLNSRAAPAQAEAVPPRTKGVHEDARHIVEADVAALCLGLLRATRRAMGVLCGTCGPCGRRARPHGTTPSRQAKRAFCAAAPKRAHMGGPSGTHTSGSGSARLPRIPCRAGAAAAAAAPCCEGLGRAAASSSCSSLSCRRCCCRCLRRCGDRAGASGLASSTITSRSCSSSAGGCRPRRRPSGAAAAALTEGPWLSSPVRSTTSPGSGRGRLGRRGTCSKRGQGVGQALLDKRIRHLPWHVAHARSC